MSTAQERKAIIDVFQRRYATKKFNPTKKISNKDFETILEAGRLSPSSFGYEPWKFLVIENEKMKNDLKDICWGAINSLNGASHFIIILARKNVTIESAHVKHMVEDVMHHEFSITSERSLFDWANKQTYIPLANMMTTAAMLGIDSCPIEGFNREKVDRYLANKEIIDPAEFGTSVMLGLGYRDQQQPVKTRQSMDEIVEVIK